MPRRANSGVKVGQMAGIGVAIIGFLVIAALLVKLIAGDILGGGSGKRRGNAIPLSLTSYRDNANSLRGNSYSIDGQIEEMLKWSKQGRLLVLKPRMVSLRCLFRFWFFGVSECEFGKGHRDANRRSGVSRGDIGRRINR